MIKNLTHVKQLAIQSKFQPQLQIIQSNPQTLKIQTDTIKKFNIQKVNQRMNSTKPSRQHFGYTTYFKNQHQLSNNKKQIKESNKQFRQTSNALNKNLQNKFQFNPLVSKSKSLYAKIMNNQPNSNKINLLKQSTSFNKYYINPDLRYKNKTIDPKKQIQTLQKQQYLYQNLHNQYFWNWIHPLQGDTINKEKNKKLSDQVDNKILLRFKRHIQSSGTHRRLPLVVMSALQKKI